MNKCYIEDFALIVFSPPVSTAKEKEKKKELLKALR